jgi:hypothetical protein
MINPSSHPKITYAKCEYKIGTVFPPGDKVAIDCLRLLGAFQDLAFIFDWFLENLKGPTAKTQEILAASLHFFQIRLLCSFLYEAILIVQGLRSETIKALSPNLDAESNQILQWLKGLKCDSSPLFELLDKTRHKAGFHFDRGAVIHGLEIINKLFKDNPYSEMIIQSRKTKDPGVFLNQPHLTIANHCREAHAFGGTGVFSAQQLDLLTDCVGKFGKLVLDLFKAYIKFKKIEDLEKFLEH